MDATRKLQKAVWSFYAMHTEYGVARAACDVYDEETQILKLVDDALDAFAQDYDLSVELRDVVTREIGNINIALVNLKAFSMTRQDEDMKIAATQVQDACERIRSAAKPYAYGLCTDESSSKA